MVICPVDPFADYGYYDIIKMMSDRAGEANLTLMGIEPTYPSEKYGYIIQDGNGKVKEFKEKPDVIAAEKYISEGALWNGGVFAFKLSYLLNKTAELCGTCNYHKLLKSYSELPKISFDYAVTEHETNINVIKYTGEWTDLGTWNTFTETMTENSFGNVTLGENCRNVHVINELNLPVVVLGAKDMAVVASHDGILVSDKNASSYLKKYIPEQRPMYEERQWGEYRVLDHKVSGDMETCITKELIIHPGKALSYQKHQHRTEIWTFISGKGVLLIDGEYRKVNRGDIAYIKPGVMHSVKGDTELHLIEVQIGNDVSEEDIERIQWEWENQYDT